MSFPKRRLAFTFQDLYEACLEDSVLFEGLQYSHASDVTLKFILKEFGNLLLGKACRSSAQIHATTPKEYIDLIHTTDIQNNQELLKRMQFFGYHYTLTKPLSDQEKSILNIPSRYGIVYVTTFEGTYPTEIKRQNLPNILFHVTTNKNLSKIKKLGLLPKSSSTSFSHPANRIYLFATINPQNDIPKLIKSLSSNTGIPMNEYRVLKIENYNPVGEKFFCDPSMDIGYVSNTCRGIFVHRGISPSYITEL